MQKRILVIDDDKDILDLLEIIFQDEGYHTILLNTGTTVKHIQSLMPDLILLDIRIIGYEKTGDQICRQIRNELSLDTVPVILVSAEHDISLRARDCGASGHISKPFDINGLLEKIKEYLS